MTELSVTLSGTVPDEWIDMAIRLCRWCCRRHMADMADAVSVDYTPAWHGFEWYRPALWRKEQ